ncbi:MAG: hypothetical protein H6852_07065 [Geminicoccaceae bacterium]|nr:hypothetical protein [Geminicoccaceae bacterium]
MFSRLAPLACALLAALLAGPAGAQAADPAAAPVAVTLVNGGAAPVDVLWVDDDGEPAPLDMTIEPGWQQVLNGWPGTELLFRESGTGDEMAPFFSVTVEEQAPAEPIVIPDPRLLRTAALTIANPLGVEVVLYWLPDEAPGETPEQTGAAWTEFDRVAAGGSVAYELDPLTPLRLRAEDGSLEVNFEVGLDSEQLLDLGTLTDPDMPTAEVTLTNESARPVVLQELRPGVTQRLGDVPAASAATVDAVVGADLRVVAGDGDLEEMGLYHVTDAADQVVLIEDAAEAGVVIPPATGIDLSLLPEDQRASAAGFLEKAGAIFAGRDDVALYVAYNGSDQPIWLAGLDGETIKGAKQMKPRSIGSVIGKVGDYSIAWPADVTPDKVTRGDVFASILVATDMPKVVDVSPPTPVRLGVGNEVCKPVDLLRVDPFGEEHLVTRLEPMGGTGEPLELPANSFLVARAGSASVLAGQALWSGQLDDSATQRIAIEPGVASGYDPMRVSVAGGAERTVNLHNSTSRGIDLFAVDENGRELVLTDAPIGAGKTQVFYIAEGTVIVARRPNVPPSISEYVRLRVGDAPTQTIDIGALRQSRGVVGSWIDLPRPALAENNEVGTTFVSFVGRGGMAIAGSTNEGDAELGGAARFEGCADDREAFGYWYPRRFEILCGETTHRDADGRETTSFGRFAAQRAASGELVLRRGYCESEPTRSSTWYRLPQHYDDMDPSLEAFQTGFYQLTWAPRSFDWMGRGFDLLRTDPLDYGSTERGVTSESPLFDFVFEDRAGSAGQTASKAIFGVRNLNEQGRSDRCDRDEKLVRTRADLEDFAAKSYGGSVGVPGIVSFSLSKSHQEINTSATGSERAFILERCDVRLHALKMDLRWPDRRGEDSLRQPLETGFRQAVGQLPLEAGDGKAYYAFLDKYGTHFAERIVYGGTFFAETEVTKSTYQIAEKEGDKLSLAAEGTIKKVSLGGTYENETSKGRANDNGHSSSTYRKWSVGGTGSDVYPVWAPTVPDNPAPIDVSFRPVYDILTPVFFPDDPNIGLKNALLRQATASYFRQHGKGDLTSDPKGLDIRDPRSICVRMDVVEYTSTSGRSGDRFVSDLSAGFVDGARNVVTDAEPFQLVHAPGNLNDARAVDPNLDPERCTPPVTASYVRSGSIYLHGVIGQYPDGWGRPSTTAELSRHFPKADQTYPLRRLEPGTPRVFEGMIQLPEGQARYKLRVRAVDQAT